MRRISVAFFALAVLWVSTFAQVINPRVPAEWEEIQGIVICIDTIKEFNGYDKLDTSIISTQCQIMKAAVKEGIDVYCFYGASVSPAQAIQAKFGISPGDVHYIYYDKGDKTGLPDPQHNVTIWLRDTGPMSVYNNEVGKLFLGNWFDDQAARWFAEEIGSPKLNLREPNVEDIRFTYTDGGNFLTDGLGNMFADISGSYQWYENEEQLIPVNQMFRDSCGIINIVRVNPIDIHVDYYIKLLNEETFVLSSIPESNFTSTRTEIDGDDKWRTAALKIVKLQLEALTAPTGRNYKVVEIPNAPTIDFFNVSEDGSVFELNISTAMLTYTNSLLMNHTVLVPQYSIPGYYDAQSFDEYALKMYRELMPGYNVIGIMTWGVASNSGTIHCLTRDIAAEDPVWIKHFWVDDTISTTANVTINATIKTQTGVKTATLFWRKGGETTFSQLAMIEKGNNGFQAIIPGQANGTEIDYYIEAQSNSGKTITKPYVAPKGFFSYFVSDGSGAGDGEPTSSSGAIELNGDDFKIFPNPATNTVYFPEINRDYQHASIKIFNLQGEKVIETQYVGRIGIADLSSGVYIVRIEVDGQLFMKKLVKQ